MCQNNTWLVILAAALVTAAVVLATPALASHPSTAQCPAGGEHCLARRQQFFQDDSVMGVAVRYGTLPVPCAQQTCDNPGDFGCGGFTAMPNWVVETASGHGSEVTVPEIGLARFGSEDGGTVWKAYGFCEGCGDEWMLLRPEDGFVPGAGTQLAVYRDPSSGCWYWTYGTHPFHVDCSGFLTEGKRVDVGGETTDWDFDMGVGSRAVLVLRKASSTSSPEWVKFNPGHKGWRDFYKPSGSGLGRYINFFRDFGGLWGAYVGLASDHHYNCGYDACGNRIC